jgi:ABC-2 type transport system permease protein
MISTLMRVSWTNLWRDRATQVLLFVVPVVFYSVFAIIFGQSNTSSMPRVDVLVVDESHTSASEGLVTALLADSSLRARTWSRPGAPRDTTRVPLDRARAEALVRSGGAPVAIVLPAGIDTSISRFDGRGEKVLLLTDPSDPVAPQVAAGLLQKAALSAGRAEADEFRGSSAGAPVPAEDLMPIRTTVQQVVGERRNQGGIVTFYAAAVAVMFLMFSASGAGGALIEENESGTLERVLSSRVGMSTLLAAKWLHIVRLGLLQITVMFTWGMLVFRVPLLTHLPGFAVMTIFTSACTAAFGLVLATLSRSRQQLAGLSNLIVLSLSAIGGSMYPRPFMSESLRKISLVGFNAWALDGYTKVFWRDEPVTALWPQLAMLAMFTVLFLAIARRLARRWETT